MIKHIGTVHPVQLAEFTNSVTLSENIVYILTEKKKTFLFERRYDIAAVAFNPSREFLSPLFSFLFLFLRLGEL